MNSLTAQAYAKINLTLDVFSKRADGYHSMASVMQAISLHDTLTFALREESGIGFTCDGESSGGIPTDATNLVVRAAQSVLDVARGEMGLQIHLHKRIPSQAGLGGGSSDAAATLLGVTALTGFDIGPKTLHNLAAALGSDVPFFLSGGTAVARGRGENISPIADAPSLWLVVVKPDENVSTGWAYNQLDEHLERASHRATKRMEEALKQGDTDRLIAWQSNDFELPVFAHFPRLAWLHDELRMAGALTAHLCGSGSALYGVFASQADAEKVAGLLRARYPRCYAARSLSRVESNPLAELGI
jgi:4-diphosphocytidyl-2-C-methyl-D-erythritol kinase